jgi:chemotaxis protein methyltransferase CheR
MGGFLGLGSKEALRMEVPVFEEINLQEKIFRKTAPA